MRAHCSKETPASPVVHGSSARPGVTSQPITPLRSSPRHPRGGGTPRTPAPVRASPRHLPVVLSPDRAADPIVFRDG